MFLKKCVQLSGYLNANKRQKKYVPGHSFQGYPVVFKSNLSVYLKWNGKKILERGWKKNTNKRTRIVS